MTVDKSFGDTSNYLHEFMLTLCATGGTDLLSGRDRTSNGGEMAVASPNSVNHMLDCYSGDDFSNVFDLLSYQSEAVTGYSTNHTPSYESSTYNNTGTSRSYPDISALSLRLATVWLGNRTALVAP